jgi:hypothetical protein
MDIKELQDYRLSDAIKFHTHLNPRIWGPDEHLLPEVREKLLAIAADFKEFLGLDLEVKDITISGSNAAYTYTDHSDIDLHLVADLPKADASEIYRELFDAKKYQYNDQHNFKIGGYDVELYVQNANEDPKSQGIYSVQDNKWISVPKRRKPDIDDISVKSKYEDLGQRIEAAIKSGNREQLETLGKKVREFRQAGLDKTGEFGPENLAFKILRSNGTLDQLRAARLAAKDQELSIEEAKKKKKKKAFRYGFGGYYYPGYHYYGQTDAAADGGGGDGGGESVRESADDLQTQLEKFAAFCVKKLGIENPPGIQLKRDPEWSRRNATFGRYVPETNAMILSVADRHPMDIMRTLAHELVHRNQDEHEPMPDHAGETGSEWENEANAKAGVLMRGYGEQNPDTFDKKALAEGKIILSTDPNWYGAEVGDYKATGPVVEIPAGQLFGFEPDDKMDQPKSKANVKKIVAGLKQGDKLPPLLVRKYKNGYQVLDGHHRFWAYKLLGVKSIPVQVVPDSDIEEKGKQGVAEGLTEARNSLFAFVKQHFPSWPDYVLRDFLYQQAKGIRDQAELDDFLKRNKQDFGNCKWTLTKLPITFDIFTPKTQRMLASREGGSSNPFQVPRDAERHAQQSQMIQQKGVNAEPIIVAKLSNGYDLIEGWHRTIQHLKAFPQGYTGPAWVCTGATYTSESVQQVVAEASGYIPVNDKEARDPRYSMAITQDIKPGENQRQAAKLGWKTTAAGTPPTARTNGLIETLTKKLQLVKEGLGYPLVSEEEDLEEVAMSPSALRSFANSEAAAGMKAGFEAELVFSGVNENSDYGEDMEPDYDQDERARDIDSIMYFFTHGDMAGIDRNPQSRSYQNARSELEQDWFEWHDEQIHAEWMDEQQTLIENWIVENDWNEDRQIKEYLSDEMELSADEISDVMSAMERRVAGKGTAADAESVEKYNEARLGVKEQLELRVTDAIEEQNSDYDSALDEFRENAYRDADESDWLRARGWRFMSDVGNNFDFEWPHWTTTGGGDEEGYNPEVAKRLADNLSETLGVKTTVSSGYHSARRDSSTWIFEPDGSLDGNEPGDMPVEIVSPPMPLSKTLEILPKFFEWAAENGAYANDSTGFHMSVSMPEHEGNMLDYTKLALFLGDEYVLKQFGREANTYAKSALQKIREKKGSVDDEEILSTMRKHLSQFASRALAQPSGFGKYTSINPKTNYIEFRSAGGSDYFADMDKIQNTLMRYARAMNIAFDPAADKPEYAKKLYKLLTDTKTQQVTDPKTGTKRTEIVPSKDNDAISIFSRYVAGELPKSELKGVLKQLQYGREVAKNPPKEKIQWQVTHPNGRASITLMAASAAEAIKLAKQEYNDTMNPDDAYRAEPVVPAAQTPATDQLNAPVPDDPRGNFVLRRREGNEGVGPVLYRFSAGTTGDAINAARRWTEARGIERRSVYLDSIASLSPEELRTTPSGTSIPDVGIDVAQNFREPPIETEPQNFPAAGNSFSGEWKVVDGLNREVYRFGGVGNSQSDANRVAREWAQRTGFDGTLEVYPVMR